ncbi:hypothetical protein ACSVH2_10585 [Flavobacterium sp. RSB2_4_14]|uniref:hypothetical protein n=1 Tax=Flavobacterium sp. RSB2_4_14 TaxID=3447665 RepID=UPI003F38845C
MKTINQEQFLLERIVSLEIQQRTQSQQLKIQFHESLQLLNPFSIIKSSLIEIDTVPEIKNVVLKGMVNLTSYYLAKNPVYGIFQRPINRLLGKVITTVVNKFKSKE